MPNYNRPPITEAVIEIRFGESLDQDDVEKIRSKLDESYPFSEPLRKMGVHVDVDHRKTHYEEESVGFRLRDKDQTDIAIITNDSIITSRLAPYTNWEHLRERAFTNWQHWKRIARYRKISRIGVRYLNRIDIPHEPGEALLLEDYLHVYPETPAPPNLPAFGRYSLQLAGLLGKDGCELLIQSAIVPPPLVKTISILLDIDVNRSSDVPQKDKDIWEQIDRIRDYKNDVFENCITDASRELFSK